MGSDSNFCHFLLSLITTGYSIYDVDHLEFILKFK